MLIAAEEGDEVMFGNRRNPLEVTDAETDEEGLKILELEGVRGGEYTLRERYDEDGELDLSVRGENANNLYFFERNDPDAPLHPDGVAPNRNALSMEVIERVAYELAEDVAQRKHYQITTDETDAHSLDNLVETRVQKWESNRPDVTFPNGFSRMDMRQLVADALRDIGDEHTLPDGEYLEDYAYELTGYPFGDADRLMDGLPERLTASSGGAFHGRSTAAALDWTDEVSEDAWTTVEEALSFGYRVPRIIGDWLLFDYGIVQSDDKRKLRWVNRDTGEIVSLRGRNGGGTPMWYVYSIRGAVDGYDDLPELDQTLPESEAAVLYEDAGVEGFGNALDHIRAYMSDEQPPDIKVRDHGDQLEVWDDLSDETWRSKLKRAIDPRDPHFRRAQTLAGATVVVAGVTLAATSSVQRTEAKESIIDFVQNPKKAWSAKSLLNGGIEVTSDDLSSFASSIRGAVGSVFGYVPDSVKAKTGKVTAGITSTLVASALWQSFGVSFTPKIRTSGGGVQQLDINVEYEYRGLSSRFMRVETSGEGVASEFDASIPVPERDLFIEDALITADRLGLSQSTIRLGYSARKKFSEGGDTPMGRGMDWLRENWRAYDSVASGYHGETLGHKDRWDDPVEAESYGKMTVIRQRRVGVSNPQDENIHIRQRFAVVTQRRDGRWLSYEHISAEPDENAIYFYPEETYDHFDAKTASPKGVVEKVLERAVHNLMMNEGTNISDGDVIQYLNAEYGRRGVNLFGDGAGQISRESIETIIGDVRQSLADDIGDIGGDPDSDDDTERQMQRQAGITEDDEETLERIRRKKGRSRRTMHQTLEQGEPAVEDVDVTEDSQAFDEPVPYDPDFDAEEGDYGEFASSEATGSEPEAPSVGEDDI